jgi:CDP-glycerol glycerophosphotransferase (TagB/SpsB family)
MGVMHHLRDVMRFIQLPKEQRRLTFYCEGKNYWPHLEGLINEVLTTSDIPICYISSEKDDPGRFLKHPNYRSFKIDEGFVRNWLFENIDTDVMVMTMPDLHQFQVKRSKHKVHYVYVQHSLVSLHMIYRKGAFDHYDTIFCAGPHHVKEIRAMEAKYNLSPKNLVEHGYGRLDAIIEESKKRPKMTKQTDSSDHVLIAPSWGLEGTIESGIGEDIVDQLIKQGNKVTLRPHPQTAKFSKDKINTILSKHANNPLFSYEANVAGQDSLHDSDFMISDWSGAALDYAFGLRKPVMFIDVPKKVNNPDYEEIGIEPFEVMIRDKIGLIMTDINLTLNEISRIEFSDLVDNYFFQNSNRRGAEALQSLLGEGSGFESMAFS